MLSDKGKGQMKGEIEITIFGGRYTLEGSEEYIKRLADYVEQRIKEGQKNSQDSFKAVITTLLSVADELFTLREKANRERVESELEKKRINGLINLIDEKIEHLYHY